MPERILGQTGVKVPIFGLGGAGQTPLSKNGQEKESVAIIEAALKLGIRYFDTAASYAPRVKIIWGKYCRLIESGYFWQAKPMRELGMGRGDI
ncbi:MAG: hypothetical protein RML39_08345 [Oscillatoriaceae cyanobacterium SKYGB_i_bin93]|nr:hypothetical protein [Oscillatoriaceae cyanobacterium SKYGB_i_bin93]